MGIGDDIAALGHDDAGTSASYTHLPHRAASAAAFSGVRAHTVTRQPACASACLLSTSRALAIPGSHVDEAAPALPRSVKAMQ